ncbi:FtsK/SpoIIIE domain-containing protein, partial [Nocardioides sp. YIM 152588]|uniref:FtsK/SpoIIIE domain-containing protein n=1 Tax=Nocardioides sp. YIM 152588 TaxID=3158259 RepID=UPI0032E3AF09
GRRRPSPAARRRQAPPPPRHRRSGGAAQVGGGFDDLRLLVGLAEPDLAPAALDADANPHLLVLGAAGSGRTALLRACCREVVRSRVPGRAQLLVVDPRRSLLGEVPPEHLLAHAPSAEAAAAALADLATYLRRRLPGPEVTPRELRERSWWSGAEVFVVVDDADLLADGPWSAGDRGGPLGPLLPLLPHARDVGLHLLLAQRAPNDPRAAVPRSEAAEALARLGAAVLTLDGRDGRAELALRGRPPVTVQLAWAPPRG